VSGRRRRRAPKQKDTVQMNITHELIERTMHMKMINSQYFMRRKKKKEEEYSMNERIYLLVVSCFLVCGV